MARYVREGVEFRTIFGDWFQHPRIGTVLTRSMFASSEELPGRNTLIAYQSLTLGVFLHHCWGARWQSDRDIPASETAAQGEWMICTPGTPFLPLHAGADAGFGLTALQLAWEDFVGSGAEPAPVEGVES